MLELRWVWFVVAGIVGLGVSLLYVRVGVTVLPLESNDVPVAVETAILLIGALAIYLMLGRYRRDGTGLDAMLAGALACLTFSAAISWWLQVFGGYLPSGVRFAELGLLHLLAALLFVPAAVLPAPWVVRNRGPLLAVGAALVPVMLLTFIHLVFASVTDLSLPALEPEGPALRGVAVIGSLAFVVASLGFARSGSRDRDTFRMFLAIAMLALSLSLFNYVLYPSAYVSHLHLGELFRLFAFVMILVGALDEIRRSWERHAADSLLAERRRIARDMHDGVAQETAYMAIASRELADRTPTPGLMDIAESAARAYEEARRIIDLYTRPPEEPLDRLLVASAEQVAHRAGARVRADCDQGIRTCPDVAEALTRIVRESVTNAVRHGHADLIELALHNDGQLQLLVRDNGCGFDGTTRRSPEGFGLLSMRERTENLGGQFRITSLPGTGTSVEVML